MKNKISVCVCVRVDEISYVDWNVYVPKKNQS